MSLDQAGLTVITHDNMKDWAFVVIKHMKRANCNPAYWVANFTSNHLVNIKDIFWEGDNNIVIVYEQMNVFLKHIITVTEGLL